MKIRMAKRMTKKLHLSLLVGAFLVLSMFMAPSMIEAASSITARYSQSSGSQLMVEINIGTPPPASVILIQRFPSGTRMLNSKPKASNYNANKSRAKWLLRNLSPGKSTVRVTLDREVQADEVSAEIRFKPQDGDKMATIQVGK